MIILKKIWPLTFSHLVSFNPGFFQKGGNVTFSYKKRGTEISFENVAISNEGNRVAIDTDVMNLMVMIMIMMMVVMMVAMMMIIIMVMIMMVMLVIMMTMIMMMMAMILSQILFLN